MSAPREPVSSVPDLMARMEAVSLCSLANKAIRWPVFSPFSKHSCCKKNLCFSAADNTTELYSDWALTHASLFSWDGSEIAFCSLVVQQVVPVAEFPLPRPPLYTSDFSN